MKVIFIWGACGALASWLIGFPAYRFLFHFGLLDKPNPRSSHTMPTVRGGGIGIVLVMIGLVGLAGLRGAFTDWATWLGALTLLAAVSFVDDMRGLTWIVRLGTHILAGIVFVLGLTVRGDLCTSFGLPVSLAVALLVLIFLVGSTNVFNFMDGINGIAAGQAVITGAGTIAIATATGISSSDRALIAAAIIVGVALGFLPHNFPGARMFMGDIGSTVLGFGLASVAVCIAAERSWSLMIPLVLLHANFVLDTGITILRRLSCGQALHQAHREHFYQRLVRSGSSHTLVTALELGLQVIVVGFLVLYVYSGPMGKWLIFGSIGCLWATFFVWIERRFRRTANMPKFVAANARQPVPPVR